MQIPAHSDAVDRTHGDEDGAAEQGSTLPSQNNAGRRTLLLPPANPLQGTSRTA